MNKILNEVIKNEVYPALGCTEPIAVAYSTAVATSILKRINISDIYAEINLDPATYKNGYAVYIPIEGDYRGNAMGAAIGIVRAKPQLKSKIFEKLTPQEIKKAIFLLKNKRIKINVDYTKKELYIESNIKSQNNKATCIIYKGHFNIFMLSINGKILKKSEKFVDKSHDYREIIKNLTLDELIDIADKADLKILKYIEKGIKINLKAAEEGSKIKKVSYFLDKTNLQNIFGNNVIYKIQKICTSATDARMGGLKIPVMSSGQSGNQGIVAILVPYLIGVEFNIEREKILKSIALSHLINSYIKSYTGELSSMCGCSISSAAAAATAIVYMFQKDTKKMISAINNVIADIGGIICDGAKESCSLKVATAVEVAIRSAFLAIEGFLLNHINGFLGTTFKETISNTARMSICGMSHIDSITIEIMKSKNQLKCTN